MKSILEQTATLDGLSDKQKEVLALVAEGMTSKEIARKIGISESAVNQRIEVIRQRLGGLPRTQIARLYRRMSTVVFTVPASNPVTGKSIQLIPEAIDEQHSAAEGSAVSTTLSQASNQVGSHPSTLLSTNLSSALDFVSRRWVRLGLIVAIALGFVALAVLLVALGNGLAQLLDAVSP